MYNTACKSCLLLMLLPPSTPVPQSRFRFSKSSSISAQLENERQARAFAEEKAETLARQRALEGERMKELEKIREQLESLLQEERQAKKDEEIVRTLQVKRCYSPNNDAKKAIYFHARIVQIYKQITSLTTSLIQARILNEEWARRETLERLQEEQKAMLESERKKREEFERMQTDKERQLRGETIIRSIKRLYFHAHASYTSSEAQMRVEEMEKERVKLDRQLNMAQEKTRKANIGQEVLEAKIKVKEQEGLLERDKVEGSLSRLNSLAPSGSFYVRGRSEGGGRMPMRSASMRETSYSRSIR